MTTSKRKPFQQATVTHVLERLLALRSSKRFLVADEVGLGKTLVAQGVLEELTKRPPGARPPVVFYMCSSKTIAEQNRVALLSMIPTTEERETITVKADRLGLVPAKPPPSSKARFLFYALTPSITSGEGTGRVEERALLVDALCSVSSILRRRTVWRGHMQRSHQVSDGRWARATATTKLVDTRVAQRFRRHLCEELGLSSHAHDPTLAGAVESGLVEAPLSTIEAMRRAMTFAVLGVLKPDVVILDEFQRFFEFLPKNEEALAEEEEDEHGYGASRRVMSAMLEGVEHQEHRPYVLMLSATPYRLYARSVEGGSHHKEFYELLRFLYDDAGHASRKISEDFSEYSERLLSDSPGSERVNAVRRRLEGKLLEVMCRTERAALVSRGAEQAFSRHESSKLDSADIRAFTLLADIAAPTRLGAEPYWSSIPYAFQAMDEQYALRKKGVVPPPKPGDAIARLDYRSVRRYTAPLNGYPHPRLRRLLEVISPSFLALPWLPPTRPWWELGGAFVGAESATKTLVFSRFRATPRILSAVLSYEAEKKAFARRPFDYAVRSHASKDTTGAKVLEGLRPQPRPTFGITFAGRREQAIRTFLSFAPFPVLAGIGDPLPLAARIGRQITYATARSEVRKNLEMVLLGGRTPADEGSRKPRVIEWLATIEKRVAGEGSFWEGFEGGLERWATEREQHGGDGGAKVCRYFLGLRPLPENEVPTSAELDELTEIALSAPGVACARAFDRVFGPARGERAKNRRYALVDAGLTAMRAYLDAPEWRELLAQRAPGKRKKRLPFGKALARAVWDGGLEAVLDELFATYCGYARPADGAAATHIDLESAALARLQTALSIHGAQVSIHHLRRKPKAEETRPRSFRMRCHAAAPLGLASSEVAEEGEALRSDDLRIAFNSPFRPMALVTTSIGQEGLDFHTYARRVVHWDLPSSPVELEQRDGRIARFGSHAVRRALATMPTAPPLEANRSPWLALGAAAAECEDESGISPWWIAPNAAIERVFIVPSFSRVRAEIRDLHDALGLYRVVLGQPGQERLLHALRTRVERAEGTSKAALQEWYENEGLCLSPFLRRRTRREAIRAATA